MRRIFWIIVLICLFALALFSFDTAFALRSTAQKNDTAEQEESGKNKTQTSKVATATVQKNKAEKGTESGKTKGVSRARRSPVSRLIPSQDYPTR